MRNVAVIGAGNIGSRHIQGICKGDFKKEITLWIVDPLPAALDLAKKRIAETEISLEGKSYLNIRFLANIDELPKKIEVAIVATNSYNRLQVIRELLSHTRIHFFILEKFLFPELSQYKQADQLFNLADTKVYVNCPRRVYPYYLKIKEKIAKSAGPIHFSFEGSGFGLSSNAIHRLDLFAFFIGHLKFNCLTNLVNASMESSKRDGYHEMTGKIFGYDDQGNSYHMTSFRSGAAKNIVGISNAEHRWLIDENKGFYFYSGIDNNWEWGKEEFSIPYQSTLTGEYIFELLDLGKCGLTEFEDSTELHRMFLEAVFPVYKSAGLIKDNVLPIT